MSPGSLGAGNVCEPSRAFAGDGVAYDVGPQAELVYRLAPLVTMLPPVPGTLGFLEALGQAESTQRDTAGSLFFRTRLALSGIAEYTQ